MSNQTPWRNELGYQRTASPSEIRAELASLVCYHEAAHACTAVSAGGRITRARIAERDSFVSIANADQLGDRALLLVYCSGRVGQRMAGYHHNDSGADTDYRRALEIAERMSDPAAAIADAERAAGEILSRCWPAVVELAASLAARGEIPGSEIEQRFASVMPSGMRARNVIVVENPGRVNAERRRELLTARLQDFDRQSAERGANLRHRYGHFE